MKNKVLFPALLVLMLVVSACASAAPTATPAPVIPITGATATVMPVATTPPTATMPPAATNTAAPVATPTAPAVVNVGQNATLGSFLVDSNGMTLYLFTKDTQGTSTTAAVSACSGGCAAIWPPLLTNGAPTAGTGVTASMLGTITRGGMVPSR